MNKKGILLSIIITLIVIVLCMYSYNDSVNNANVAYQVYLQGKKIGMIKNDQELYDMINQEQQEIKNEYGVDNVYPPKDFNIIKTNTFSTNLQTTEDIYKIIESTDDFTIEGYIIKVKHDKDKYIEGEEIPDDIEIYVLDKNVFEEAIHNYIYAFVSEADYNKYINGTFGELTEEGQFTINDMYFKENISIEKGYISVKNKIYKNVTDLAQYLLFGEGAKMEEYIVKVGDTINSISDKYEINAQEFLIANPEYRDENTLLRVNSKVNVTLINPVLSFVYEVNELSIDEEKFTTKEEVDETKSADYREIAVQGVNGLTKNYSVYEVVNGEATSEVKFLGDSVVIREMTEQVVIVGKKRKGLYSDGSYAWATNSPYRITSPYAWRGGKFHLGIDISGTGKDSPIYSIADGEVVEARNACVNNRCNRWAEGTYVVIKHDNNIYSMYAHMSYKTVEVGDIVSRKDIIGGMGDSGLAYGVHLHLSVSKGWPYHGSYQFFNPVLLY